MSRLRIADACATAVSAVDMGDGNQRENRPISVHFAGLRAFFDRLLDDIAITSASNRLNFPAVSHVIRQTAQRLEHSVAHDTRQITSQSRALLGWFRYFADEDALQSYVDAVVRWHVVVKGVTTSRWRETLLVHFRPTKHMYHWRRFSFGTRITLPTAMICFDDALFQQLVQYMLRRHQPAAAITAAMLVPPYRTMADQMDRLGGAVEQTQGMVYDLADSFARVNRGYFNNQSQRPALMWGQRLTRRKFGHYDLVRDTVMISRTLDHPNVPVFVLDHVMHHELLHKKHGFNNVGSRRCFHTPAFRAEERTFARFQEADRFLNQLARARSC